MATIPIPGDHNAILYGAYHHHNSTKPCFRLNTDAGRLRTIDESVSPNPWVELNEDGEPMWGNHNNGVDVILTLDIDGYVTGIRDA